MKAANKVFFKKLSKKPLTKKTITTTTRTITKGRLWLILHLLSHLKMTFFELELMVSPILPTVVVNAENDDNS